MRDRYHIVCVYETRIGGLAERAKKNQKRSVYYTITVMFLKIENVLFRAYINSIDTSLTRPGWQRKRKRMASKMGRKSGRVR